MAIAGVADLVRAIREGSIPVEVAYGRIVELVKRTQKTVFGDRAQTAWCLFVCGTGREVKNTTVRLGVGRKVMTWWNGDKMEGEKT